MTKHRLSLRTITGAATALSRGTSKKWRQPQWPMPAFRPERCPSAEDSYRAGQRSAGFLNLGTELNNPNFAVIAEAVGIRGIRIEDPAKVEDGIAAAFAHDGPVLINAAVNRTELAMPLSINVETAKSFSPNMVKAMMSERTDEVIDLAKTNLWR